MGQTLLPAVQKWESPNSGKHPTGAVAKLLQLIEYSPIPAEFHIIVSTIVSLFCITNCFSPVKRESFSLDNRFIVTADIITTLRLNGRLQAGELLKSLGVSRATLMRLARAAGNEVIVRGNARRTTYAARRALRGSLAALPLYRVNEYGDVQEIARLDLTYPDGCAAEFLADFDWPLDEDMQAGWFDGLPYPLHDMRPQGFLGRNFARHYAEMLQVPADPKDWSDDHALHAMSLLGVDLPGNLIVGEPACRQWLERLQAARLDHSDAPLSEHQVEQVYASLAETAMAQGVGGSSAGGEFPKFMAVRQFSDGRVQHVLVKFSGSDDSTGTQRWADLLVCEHLASLILPAQLGVGAAASRIHHSGGRTFLEVERFDRHGLLGRSGVTSWLSLNAALFGLAGVPWTEAARQVARRGWLSERDTGNIALLWHFGQLIGNTDMHEGNLSFLPNARDGQAGLRLSPVYDMLPMLYAPARGVELPARNFEPKLPLPAEREDWDRAAHAAIAFWQTAAADEGISTGFRALCADNAAVLLKLMSR